MRMKRLLAVMAGALCFCSALLFPVQTQAAEQSNGTVTITTTVPETHTATLSITGEGTGTVDGKTYAAQSQELEIPRLEELVWTFTPADGYELEAVLYNGTDVTEELTDQSYKADPVYENGTEVEVIFAADETGAGTGGRQDDKDTPSGSQTDKGSSQTDKDSSRSGKVQTGDGTGAGLWVGMLAVSILLVILSVKTAGNLFRKDN